MAGGLDIVVRLCMPPCEPVQSPRSLFLFTQCDVAAQTRLPTIAHELRSDEALQFAERCQRDDAVFRQAVAGVAELIDWPEVETLSLLRLAPCFPIHSNTASLGAWFNHLLHGIAEL